MSNTRLHRSLALVLSIALIASLVPAVFAAVPQPSRPQGKGRCSEECSAELDALWDLKDEAKDLRAERKELRLEFAGLDREDPRRAELREEIKGIQQELKDLRAERKEAHAAVRACRQACLKGGS